MTWKLIIVSTLWLAVAPPLPAQEAACPVEGKDAPLALHREWMMEGWERREGDPPFVFVEKMGKYYDTGDAGGVFYDNFAPGKTQLFDDALRYGRNWEDLQNAARSVRHGLTGGHHALADGRVASTTLGFVGRIDRLDGEVIAFDARSQLGWECRNGSWKIRHELNHAWPVEPEVIAHRLGRHGGI